MAAPPSSTAAESVCSFVELVLSTHSEWSRAGLTGDLWFRGSPSAAHPLLPTSYRDDVADEEQQFGEFKNLALSLADPRPQDDWEWYFLARHHGLKTRLLDWTESALGALFHAVTSSTEGSDRAACVWLLNPSELNHWAAEGQGGREICAPMTDEAFNAWLPSRCRRDRPTDLRAGAIRRDNSKPIAIYPRRIGARMIAQQAMFTLHGTDPRPLDDMLVGPGLLRIDVPAARRSAVARQLEVLGLTHATWFPDLDGIARSIAARHS
jgi:hypothetical protein